MSSDPRIRASDADRDRTAALLREHHAAGRLTAEEFNERLDKAYAAKTLGDLDQLLSDLPGIDLYRAARQRPHIARLAGGLGVLGHGQRHCVPRLAAQRPSGQPVVPVGVRDIWHRPVRAVGVPRVAAAGPRPPRASLGLRKAPPGAEGRPVRNGARCGTARNGARCGITGPVPAFALSVDVA